MKSIEPNHNPSTYNIKKTVTVAIQIKCKSSDNQFSIIEVLLWTPLGAKSDCGRTVRLRIELVWLSDLV